jgi:hypothetical protein
MQAFVTIFQHSIYQSHDGSPAKHHMDDQGKPFADMFRVLSDMHVITRFEKLKQALNHG